MVSCYITLVPAPGLCTAPARETGLSAGIWRERMLPHERKRKKRPLKNRNVKLEPSWKFMTIKIWTRTQNWTEHNFAKLVSTGKTRMVGLPYAEKVRWYVKPFWYNTRMWQTNGQTELPYRYCASITGPSLVTAKPSNCRHTHYTADYIITLIRRQPLTAVRLCRVYTETLPVIHAVTVWTCNHQSNPAAVWETIAPTQSTLPQTFCHSLILTSHTKQKWLSHSRIDPNTPHNSESAWSCLVSQQSPIVTIIAYPNSKLTVSSLLDASVTSYYASDSLATYI